MKPSLEWVIGLLAAGAVMIGAEVFLPGGVLGLLGALALVAGVGLAFFVSPTTGLVASVVVVLLVGVVVYLWIRIFPRTRLGRTMTLQQDGADFRTDDAGSPELLGAEGVAQSELRPAGFALLNGRKVDVVAEGRLVPRGARVRVVKVEGRRVVVAPLGEAPPRA